jgi:hypothetical protein
LEEGREVGELEGLSVGKGFKGTGCGMRDARFGTWNDQNKVYIII